MLKKALLATAMFLSIPQLALASEIQVPIQESKCPGFVTINVIKRYMPSNSFRLMGEIQNDTSCPLSGVVVHYSYQVGPHQTVLAKGSKKISSTNSEPLMPGERTFFQASSHRYGSSRSQEEPILKFAVSVASDR